MARKNKYFPAIQRQLPSHCGPTSLSLALAILMGKYISPRTLAREGGRPVSAFWEGLNDKELSCAARKHSVRVRHVFLRKRGEGMSFIRTVREHVIHKGPAVVLAWDFEHWVCVIAYRNGKFIVRDPDKDPRILNSWSPETLKRVAWNAEYNDEDSESEPDQYFALLITRKDGKLPAVTVDSRFLRRCKKEG